MEMYLLFKECLILAFVVALLAAFVISLLRKLGFVEYVQVHGNKLFSEMFSCDFCLSFWVGFVVSFVLLVITGNPAFCGVPFLSVTITRFLL